MKKFLSLTLTIIMLLTLISCAPKKKTAYEIITEAQTKMAKLNSNEIDVEMLLKLGTLGLNFSIPATINIKANELTSGSPKASMHSDLSFLGVEIGLDLYYENDYLYLSTMGSNVKLSTKELTGIMSGKDTSPEATSLQNEFDEILKNVLAEVEVQENEDGSQTIAYVINGEIMNNFIIKIMEASATEEDNQPTSVDCSDLEISQTVNKNGYITNFDIKFKMSVVQDLGEEGAALGIETSTTTYNIEAYITLNNPTAPVEVTPIDGYETFEEVAPEDQIGRAHD